MHPLSKKNKVVDFFDNLDFFHGKKIPGIKPELFELLNFLNFYYFKRKMYCKAKKFKKFKSSKVQKKFLEYFFHGKKSDNSKKIQDFFMEKSSKSSWVIFVNDH